MSVAPKPGNYTRSTPDNPYLSVLYNRCHEAYTTHFAYLMCINGLVACTSTEFVIGFNWVS